MKDGGGTTLAIYAYDPLDRLRTVDYGGSNRIRFRYVGLTTSAAQWLDDVAGTVTRSVGTGWNGERLLDWTGSGSNIRIYGENAHHDVTWLASSTGTVSQALRYDPWGNPRPTTVPTGYSPFRFQGSWFDDTTSLSWVVTRWYAPSLGRFISEDTLLGDAADPPSRHLYAYGQGEPVATWDPGGQFWHFTGPRAQSLGVIASVYLGKSSRWPMLLNANLNQFAATATASSTARAYSWVYVPVQWLYLPRDLNRYSRRDDVAPPWSHPTVRGSYRPITREWAAKMHDAQLIGKLGDFEAAFSFTRNQLQAYVDKKSGYRARAPTASQLSGYRARLSSVNANARRVANGDAQSYLGDVKLVKGDNAPTWCFARPCTYGQYI